MRRVKNERNTQYAIRNTIDEPAIFTENCPQAKVVVNPDRVAGAAEAVNKFDAKVLILDDGFQHRRLARDLDIVTIDATLPFGYGRLLPAGLLREPVTSLKRANAVVITRCDQVQEDELSELEQKLNQINPNMVIARSIHAPACAKTIENNEIGLEKLWGKRIFAFCGIGNPNAFLETIKGLSCDVVGSKVYNDHYHYTQSDIADMHNQSKHLEAELILTTQKDWTSTHDALHMPAPPAPSKVEGSEVEGTHYEIPFAYLIVDLKFSSGEDKLIALIESALAGKIPTK
jgi:tetraacyldisaccharide 4'-kinase